MACRYKLIKRWFPTTLALSIYASCQTRAHQCLYPVHGNHVHLMSEPVTQVAWWMGCVCYVSGPVVHGTSLVPDHTRLAPHITHCRALSSRGHAGLRRLCSWCHPLPLLGPRGARLISRTQVSIAVLCDYSPGRVSRQEALDHAGPGPPGAAGHPGGTSPPPEAAEVAGLGRGSGPGSCTNIGSLPPARAWEVKHFGEKMQ